MGGMNRQERRLIGVLGGTVLVVGIAAGVATAGSDSDPSEVRTLNLAVDEGSTTMVPTETTLAVVPEPQIEEEPVTETPTPATVKPLPVIEAAPEPEVPQVATPSLAQQASCVTTLSVLQNSIRDGDDAGAAKARAWLAASDYKFSAERMDDLVQTDGAGFQAACISF